MEQLRYLEEKFLNNDFADIQFVINADEQTVTIPSHKVILASGSLPLGKRFNKNPELNKIEIVNATSAAFEEFLFTFYSAYPEKNFTIANAHTVLALGRTFEVVHCIKACERFLVKCLPLEQLCFGLLLATEYSLFDLKSHCIKRINENKRNVFVSHTFLACNEEVLNDILENLTVNQRDDFKTVWNGCMNWAKKQCTIRSMDECDVKNWREVFGKSINQIQTILSKDGEFYSQINAFYNKLFENDENQNELWATCDATIHQNVTQSITDMDESETKQELECVRFHETILSPQTCSASVPLLIELWSTKRIALNGIAFTTVSGTPRGKLTIGVRSDDKVTTLIEQLINSKPMRIEPKNFVAIEPSITLEANKVYIVTVDLLKDIAYRPSRQIEPTFKANSFDVFFKTANARRDIFSHFFFSENF